MVNTLFATFRLFVDMSLFVWYIYHCKEGETLKERLKKLRKALGLTQQEFANRIGISRGNVATYETRDGNPGSSVINLICREFNASETWLRTGEGEMFVQRSKDDELAQVLAAISASDGDLGDLIKRIIWAYWHLDEKEKAAVKKLIDGFSSGGSGSSAAPVLAPAHPPTIEEEALAEAEQQKQMIYEQILAEKKAQAGLSSESSEPSAGGGTAKQA